MDTNLEIIISAIDEASETMAEVGASLNEMSESAAEATAETGAAFDSLTESVSENVAAQEASFALLTEVLQTDNSEIQEAILATGQTYAEVTAQMAANDAEQEASSTEAATATKANYGALAAVAGVAFYGITSAVSNAVSAAEAWDETSAQIAQILQDTGASIPLSQIQAYAQQVQGLTLFSQQDVLSSEALIMSHTNLQGSYQQTTMMAADLATKMGTDLPNATRMLTNALTDPVAGLNQLIRQGNIDFPAAAVTMIENLAKAGDTAGADAVIMQTLSGSIGGLATAAAGAPGAALTQLNNQLTATATVIGNDLLPLLDAVAKDLEPVIQDITAWAAEHPKVTDAIVIGAVAITGLLLLLGLFALAAIGVTAALTALAAIFTPIIAAIAFIGAPIVLLGALFTATALLIMDNWNALSADLTAIGQILATNWDNTWNGMFTFVQGVVNQMKSWISDVLGEIGTLWNAAWTADYTFFMNIWTTIVNGLKSELNAAIGLINGFISAIDAIHISIPAIQIPGTKIGTPAVNVGFDIPTIPALATGGIVSVPTVALIGEGGPEAVVPLSSQGLSAFGGATGAVGAGQQIVVNIQGGNYLDQQGAKMIGDALAKQILNSVRAKNYAL